MYIVTIARYQVILDTEMAELIKVEREMQTFLFIFVPAPFKLQAKAPFSQIRRVNQASTYSLWYR